MATAFYFLPWEDVFFLGALTPHFPPLVLPSYFPLLCILEDKGFPFRPLCQALNGSFNARPFLGTGNRELPSQSKGNGGAEKNGFAIHTLAEMSKNENSHS